MTPDLMEMSCITSRFPSNLGPLFPDSDLSARSTFALREKFKFHTWVRCGTPEGFPLYYQCAALAIYPLLPIPRTAFFNMNKLINTSS